MEGVLKTLKKKNEELRQKSHDFIDSFEPSTVSVPDSPIFKEMSAELKNVQAEIEQQKVEHGERVVEMVSISFIYRLANIFLTVDSATSLGLT